MKNNNKFKLDLWGGITLGILILYAIFLLYPLLNMFKDAVIGAAGLTMEHFAKFFSRPYYTNALKNSFVVSFAATFTSIAVGTPLAYIFTQYKIKGKKVMQMLIIIASMSAPFIGAYSWILLMGRSGVITNLLKPLGIILPDIYGFGGILLVFTLQLYPLVFLYVQGALSNVDNSLIEASENMGCTGFRRFFKIIIPLIMPTLLASSLLVFMRAFADFGTPMLIGEGWLTFPVLLFNEFISEVGGDSAFASALSIIAILITTIFFLGQRWLSNRKSFSMNSLHPIEEKEVHGFKSFWLHFYSYFVVGFAVMPQVYVIYTSFMNYKGMVRQPGYSLDQYKQIFSSSLGRSVWNTLFIPIVALIIIVLLAVLIAYIAVRRRNWLTGIVDTISMVPYIVPGTVIGIALITAFKRPITGGMLIMVIALVIRRLPYTIRSSVAILQQIPMSIEEAALSLGSNKAKTFFKITMPMMSAGIISGAILSWVTMISELSTAIILYSVKTQTLTVSIYTSVIRGQYGVAAALSTVLTVLTVISLLVFNKFSGGKSVQS